MFFPHLLSGYLDTEFRLRRQVRTLRNLQAITILLNRLEEEGRQHPLLKMLHELIPRSLFFNDKLIEPAALMSDLDVLQARATYYGLMSQVDHHLGRVINYLKKSGQYESTLIIYQSPVSMEHLPREHFLSIFQHYILVSWIIGTVYKLFRILLQIKQKGLQGGHMDEFVMFITQNGK